MNVFEKPFNKVGDFGIGDIFLNGLTFVKLYFFFLFREIWFHENSLILVVAEFNSVKYNCPFTKPFFKLTTRKIKPKNFRDFFYLEKFHLAKIYPIKVRLLLIFVLIDIS